MTPVLSVLDTQSNFQKHPRPCTSRLSSSTHSSNIGSFYPRSSAVHSCCDSHFGEEQQSAHLDYNGFFRHIHPLYVWHYESSHTRAIHGWSNVRRMKCGETTRTPFLSAYTPSIRLHMKR